MAEDQKLSKESVNYGAGKEVTHCGNCKHFQPTSNPFAMGTCKLVAGAVQWFKWCKLWEGK